VCGLLASWSGAGVPYTGSRSRYPPDQCLCRKAHLQADRWSLVIQGWTCELCSVVPHGPHHSKRSARESQPEDGRVTCGQRQTRPCSGIVGSLAHGHSQLQRSSARCCSLWQQHAVVWAGGRTTQTRAATCLQCVQLALPCCVRPSLLSCMSASSSCRFLHYVNGSCSLQSAEWHGSVENINWRPRASRFRGFLTPAECDFLIAKVHH
jgi:hypothetical protein